MSTIDIQYCDIPVHLRNGDFFRSLDKDDPKGLIQLPADCFPEAEAIVSTLVQFTQMLRAMTFWLLDEIPQAVILFCSQNVVEVWKDSVLSLPGGDQSTVARGLLATFQTPIHFKEVLESGHWNLIICCIDIMVADVESYADTTEITAQCGNVRVLKLLYEKGFVWHKDTCTTAARYGHLECLQYAYMNGCEWDVAVLSVAAKGGHLQCLQYAHQQGLQWEIDVTVWAAQYGQLECLQYAHRNGCPWDHTLYVVSAMGGHLECIEYAHQQGLVWDAADVTWWAARYGHANCLLYALQHSIPPLHDLLCDAAAWEGHLHCLQLLHQYNAPWDVNTCAAAARNNHLVCLQYLHTQHCPWDVSTTEVAALYGQFETLQYAINSGCDCNTTTILNTIKAGNIKCLQYIIEQRGLPIENNELFITALLKGNLPCIQYLLDQGCDYHNAHFADKHQWDMYDSIFIINNTEFIECLELVTARGWRINKHGVKYLYSRDKWNCMEFLNKHKLRHRTCIIS